MQLNVQLDRLGGLLIAAADIVEDLEEADDMRVLMRRLLFLTGKRIAQQSRDGNLDEPANVN